MRLYCVSTKSFDPNPTRFEGVCGAAATEQLHALVQLPGGTPLYLQFEEPLVPESGEAAAAAGKIAADARKLRCCRLGHELSLVPRIGKACDTCGKVCALYDTWYSCQAFSQQEAEKIHEAKFRPSRLGEQQEQKNHTLTEPCEFDLCEVCSMAEAEQRKQEQKEQASKASPGGFKFGGSNPELFGSSEGQVQNANPAAMAKRNLKHYKRKGRGGRKKGSPKVPPKQAAAPEQVPRPALAWGGAHPPPPSVGLFASEGWPSGAPVRNAFGASGATAEGGGKAARPEYAPRPGHFA